MMVNAVALIDESAMVPDPTLSNDFSILETFNAGHIENLRGQIRALPQAAFLDDEKINRWLSAVMSFEPQRVEWHIKRLMGIGGSEMGTVVAPFMNQHDPFDTPRDIWNDKMMHTLPGPPTGDMLRGIFMEDPLREMFRKEFRAVELADEMKAISAFKDADHPWLVGNPDEFVLINGVPYMADYKCPRPGFTDKYDKEGISFGYFIQLHHYTLMAKRLGIDVQGLLLVSFDMVTWKLDVRRVEINEAVFDHILRAGDWMFYECMLKNQPPRVASKPRVAIKKGDTDGERIMQLLDRSSRLSSIANAAYAEDKEVKAELQNLLADRRLGETKLMHGLMDVTAKEVFNEEKASQILTEFGYDMDDFLMDSGLDASKVVEKAKESGLDLSDCNIRVPNIELMMAVLEKQEVLPEKYMDEEVKVGITRTTVPHVKVEKDGIKAAAKEVIRKFEEDTKGKFVPVKPEQASAELALEKPVSQKPVPELKLVEQEPAEPAQAQSNPAPAPARRSIMRRS